MLPSKFRRARAFTLVEMMVATGLVGVASLGMISVLTSTMKLSSQNTVTNSTNYRARQTIDRLVKTVRYAQEAPTLVTNTLAAATGTTADGIQIKNVLPGMYVIKNATGNPDDDIAKGTTRIMVQYAPTSTDPGGRIPDFEIPQSASAPLEYLLINTSSHPEIAITGVDSPSLSGTTMSVKVNLAQGLPDAISPKTYNTGAVRYRKEAYVFLQSGSQWTLRTYHHVFAGMSLTDKNYYADLGTGFQKNGTQAWFTTTTTSDGAQAIWFQGIARSSNHAEYAENISKHTTLTTMPVQVKLWNYNPPTPSS